MIHIIKKIMKIDLIYIIAKLFFAQFINIGGLKIFLRTFIFS